jgi:GAF domain-containing protein
LYTRIIELTEVLLRSDCAGLWLPVNENVLELRAASGSLQALIGQRLAIGEGVAGRVYATSLALRLDDIRTWKDAALDFGEVSVRSALASPMIWQGQPIGVLVAAHTLPDKTFTADDGNAAQLFSAQAASAIENVHAARQTLTRQANKRLTVASQQHLRANEIIISINAPLARSRTADATMTVPINCAAAYRPIVMEDDQPQRQPPLRSASWCRKWCSAALALEGAPAQQTQSALAKPPPGPASG